MNLREQIGVECDRGIILRAGGDLGQTRIEVAEEPRQVEPQMPGRVGLEIAVDAAVELAGTADVAVAKLLEEHG